MRCRARTAYALTFTSFLFILVGWISPFWFGRFYESSRSKKQWGLFYVIICEIGSCTNVGRILDKDHVDFGGADSPIVLEAISVLATISMALTLLGLVIVLQFHCHVCGKNYSYHNYVISAAIVQFTAAAFVFLTIILSSISTSVFFSKTPMDDVIEFPWSLLCYYLGEVSLIASAVIYLLITCHWKQYRHIYAKKRYMLSGPNGHYGNALYRENEPLPDYTIDRKYRYKPYNRDSFIGYFRGARNDTQSTEAAGNKDGYFFPNRSPWERSRYYYTYPYKTTKVDKTDKGTENVQNFTINSEFRRSRHNSLDGKKSGNSRVWHTTGDWNTSLAKNMDKKRDLYM